MWLMNRQWLRQIYLNCFYIPELIQLANDVETTQVQELLIQQKLLSHHRVNRVKVMLKYLVQQMQAHNVWQCFCRYSFIISEI